MLLPKTNNITVVTSSVFYFTVFGKAPAASTSTFDHWSYSCPGSVWHDQARVCCTLVLFQRRKLKCRLVSSGSSKNPLNFLECTAANILGCALKNVPSYHVTSHLIVSWHTTTTKHVVLFPALLLRRVFLNMSCAYKCWQGDENLLLLHEPTTHPSPSIHVWRLILLLTAKVCISINLKAAAKRMMGNLSQVKAASLPPFSPCLASFFSVCRWRVRLANRSKAFTLGCFDAKQSAPFIHTFMFL